MASMPDKGDALEKRILAMHPLDFEELCAELVTELGFINVRRQGGGTQFGRDIAAEFPGNHVECWIFECKRYAKIIPLKEISNKLLWAQAMSTLNYFVVISNAEISNDFRQLIDLPSNRSYKVLTWTGPTFRRLLAACPSTVSSWFGGVKAEPAIYANVFLREQRGASPSAALPNVVGEGETFSVTVRRSPRTRGDDPCYAIIVDDQGNEIAQITLKRGQEARFQLPKVLQGRPVRIAYDFEPHACMARHYPDEENLLLTPELSLPSEHLKIRIRAVSSIPMERWSKYTGIFYRGTN